MKAIEGYTNQFFSSFQMNLTWPSFPRSCVKWFIKYMENQNVHMWRYNPLGSLGIDGVSPSLPTGINKWCLIDWVWKTSKGDEIWVYFGGKNPC